jgi:hypothetical protein
VKFIENNCNATRNPGGVFFVSACAAVKLIPKEKGKKESAFRGAGFCGCKLFDLKIFLLKNRKEKMGGIH